MGIVAGVCFVGVAAVPANLNSPQHGIFVFWAFRAFLGAVLPFVLLIFTQKAYPKFGAWIFVIFTVFLLGYIGLITNGPSPKSPGGLFIQVVGQKIIVYASVACVGLQAIVARQFLRSQRL
jgi:FtsH-binding integral membrane protein